MRLNRLLASVAVLAMTVTAATAQTPAGQTPSQEPEEVIIDQGVLRPFQIAVAAVTVIARTATLARSRFSRIEGSRSLRRPPVLVAEPVA